MSSRLSEFFYHARTLSNVEARSNKLETNCLIVENNKNSLERVVSKVTKQSRKVENTKNNSETIY
jgi:hypothetical protein